MLSLERHSAIPMAASERTWNVEMNQEKLLSDSNINSKDALPGEKVGGYTAASIL